MIVAVTGPRDICDADTPSLVCAASRKLRKRPHLMCSPRAPIGETCVHHVDRYERARRERERRAARARMDAILWLAMRGGFR